MTAKFRWGGVSNLLMASVLLNGCVTAIQAFQVPVGAVESPNSSAGMQGRTSDEATRVAAWNPGLPREPNREQPRYLSAVAFFEHRNLPAWHKNSKVCDGKDHWYCSGDRVLVNAEVSIPSKNKSITSTLPLFLVSDGLVESQVGVDLLKKYPILADARGKASIKLNIRYIPNSQVLEKVRGVLRAATEAASTLSTEVPNVEVALKVAGSINKVLSSVLDQTEDVKPSSITTIVDSDVLSSAFAAGGDQSSFDVIQAFILAPSNEVGHQMYTEIKQMYPCSDLSGTLCYKRSGSKDAGGKVAADGATDPAAKQDVSAKLYYNEDRVSDYVYLTITYKSFKTVYDPMILLDSPAAACEELTKEEVNSARAYLTSNQALFTPDDAATARRAIVFGEHYLAVRDAIGRHDYARLLDLAASMDDLMSSYYGSYRPSYSLHGSSPDNKIVGSEQTMRDCVMQFWNSSPARDVLDAYNGFNMAKKYCSEEGRTPNDDCMVSVYGASLQTLCDLLGLDIDRVLLGDERAIVQRGNKIPVIYEKMRSILGRQAVTAADRSTRLTKLICENEKSFSEFYATTFSPYCSACRKTLKDKCASLQSSTGVVEAFFDRIIKDRTSTVSLSDLSSRGSSSTKTEEGKKPLEGGDKKQPEGGNKSP